MTECPISATMSIKDIATLVVSVAALITSISVAIFNINIQKSKKSDDARKSFDDGISGIIAAKVDFEKLKRELGDEFDDPKNLPRRVAIIDSRNFYISKATRAFEISSFMTSAADNMTLAAALIESGRIASSLPFYSKAVERADDDYVRATMRRVHGRALILSKQLEDGRDEMLRSARELITLSNNPDFDSWRMLREEADTRRRLFMAQKDSGQHKYLAKDLADLKLVMHRLDRPVRDMIEKIAQEMGLEDEKI